MGYRLPLSQFKKENLRDERVALVSASIKGHRRRWLEFCQTVAKMDAYEDVRIKTLTNLVCRRKVFLMNLDDHPYSGITFMLIRLVLRRETSCFSVSPQFVLNASTLNQRLKQLLYRALARNKLVKFYFCGADRDPQHYSWGQQLFDINFLDLQILPIVPIRPIELVRGFGGMKLVAATGVHRSEKLTELFMSTFIFSEELRSSCIFGVFGMCSGLNKNIMSEFCSAGGLLIDRYLSDEELIWLEMNSSVLWGLYSPVYDQTSGVFGHSVQLGTPCLVRRDSGLEKLQQHFCYRLVAEPSCESIATTLTDLFKKPIVVSSSIMLENTNIEVNRWRHALS